MSKLCHLLPSVIATVIILSPPPRHQITKNTHLLSLNQTYFFEYFLDCLMTIHKLKGSGGYVMADITDQQAKKADLGVGTLFLASADKLDTKQMSKYYCNTCEKEFETPAQIHIEEQGNEQVSDNLTLIERGQYKCNQCGSIIGEYRVFSKNDGNPASDAGQAKKPST